MRVDWIAGRGGSNVSSGKSIPERSGADSFSKSLIIESDWRRSRRRRAEMDEFDGF
jgi:hypothetical protein